MNRLPNGMTQGMSDDVPVSQAASNVPNTRKIADIPLIGDITPEQFRNAIDAVISSRTVAGLPLTGDIDSYALWRNIIPITSLFVYVAPGGSDTENDGLSSDYPFKTLAKAVSMGNPWTFLHIKLADGTYNVGAYNSETLFSIESLGGLTIESLSGVKENCILTGILAIQANEYVSIDKLTFTLPVESTAYSSCIALSSKGRVRNCIINGRTDVANCYGVAAYKSNVDIESCIINNCTYAITAGNTSVVASVSNTGTGNINGLYAATGIILISGSQPTATTAQMKVNGGQILS